MSGDKVEILPDHIRLTLGLRDILVLRNHDDVPQIFGPTLSGPTREAIAEAPQALRAALILGSPDFMRR